MNPSARILSSRDLNISASLRVSCILGVVLLMLLQSLVCRADDPLVIGRYQRTSAATVTVRIIVGSPAPQSLILEQYLPPGTQVLSMSPAGHQVSNSGVVKWLFKNVSPGSFDVNLQLEPPSAAQTIGGTIRYRMPGSGKIQEIRLSR